MNRGCIIALIVFGVSVFVLFALLFVVPVVMFDVIRSAPRVPISAFATDKTVVALRVDPNQTALSTIFAHAGSRPDWLFPHELGFVLDLDDTRSTRTLTLAASPKHLGPLYMMMFEGTDFFHPDDLGITGIDTWLTPKPIREKGAIILRGTGQVTDETLAALAQPPAEATPRKPATLEGTHAIEFVAENANGEALLALHPYIAAETDDEAEAAAPESPDATSEPSPAISDAPTPVEKPAEDSSEKEPAEASPVTAEAENAETASGPQDADAEVEEGAGYTYLLQISSGIHVVGDFTGDDEFTVTSTVTCKDADATEVMKSWFGAIEEEVKAAAAEEKMTATFDASAADNVLTCKTVLKGFAKPMEKWLRENNR